MKIRLTLLTAVAIMLAQSASAIEKVLNVTDQSTLILELMGDYESGIAEQVTKLIVNGPLEEAYVSIILPFYTNVEELDLSGATLERFASSTDYMQHMQKVILPTSTTEILDGAFRGCPVLTEVVMPAVEKMGAHVFSDCSSLRELNLPETLRQARGSIEKCPALTDVYYHSLTPCANLFSYPDEGGAGGSGDEDDWGDVIIGYEAPARQLRAAWGQTQITHHVPAATLGSYRSVLGERSNHVFVPSAEPVSHAVIDQEITIESNEGLDGCDVRLVVSGESWEDPHVGVLTIDAGLSALALDTFSMHIDYHSSEYYSSSHAYRHDRMTRLLVKGTPVSAAEVILTMAESGTTETWTFFSLPFDCNVSDIDPGVSRWALRRFDDDQRAISAARAWIDVKPGEQLKAHQGYIITREHWDYDPFDQDEDYYEDEELDLHEKTPFTFRAAATSSKQDIFSTSDATLPLSLHQANRPHNANWNFVGNPYPSNYQISGIRERVNLLVLHNDIYVAYNTRDDDLSLAPFQPFFLQSSQSCTSLHFDRDTRFADLYDLPEYDPYYAPRRLAPASADRQIFNLLLSDGVRTDRTRLVINPDATTDYEINRDAPKMMSSRQDVSQIFISDGGLRLSIDERPLSEGVFSLDMLIGSTVEHTLSLDASDSELSVFLIDNVTGVVADLRANSYTFAAQSGVLSGRFSLIVGQDATAISQLPVEAVSAQTYDLLGRKMDSTAVQHGLTINNNKVSFIR